MALRHVTLKAQLKRGTFYWVCDVEAAGEDEAVTAAENLFEAELEKAADWSFEDYQVE